MRVHVNSEAERLLLLARKQLLAKACKATPSRVASAALEIFFTKYFDSERKNLERRFFDRKSYLKKVLMESSEDDEVLSDSLKELLTKMKTKKKTSSKKSTENSKEVLND